MKTLTSIYHDFSAPYNEPRNFIFQIFWSNQRSLFVGTFIRSCKNGYEPEQKYSMSTYTPASRLRTVKTVQFRQWFPVHCRASCCSSGVALLYHKSKNVLYHKYRKKELQYIGDWLMFPFSAFSSFIAVVLYALCAGAHSASLKPKISWWLFTFP